MCKMDNSPISRSLPVWMLVLLVLSTCVLAFHFIIEDMVIITDLPNSIASEIVHDETNHMDDLAVLSCKPVQIPHSLNIFDLPASDTQLAQPFFPQFKPPKS